ncbi:MAG: AbrB/MazE/SpoVT family DNA-binding domain-containing protein [Candidatus Dormibacteraeota bacterium]|nr:AbrB/MazE/SpoVT family DNA-binding domain-containing protein [Candidatus Dormibacteraeota bacterium]
MRKSNPTEIARLRSNGQLTLPAALRRAAELQEGDSVALLLQEDGSITLTPIVVMDRLDADLLLRLQVRDSASLTSTDLRSRADDFARTREVGLSSGDTVAELAAHFRQGHMSESALIAHAVSLGLPASTIVTLVATQSQLPNRPSAEAAVIDAERGRGAGQGHGDTVRIAQAFRSLLYLPLYIARDAGFFEAEGVRVQISTSGGGPEAWAQVVSGEADYSIHDPVFAVAAYEGGMADAVVVATICNGQAIVAAGSGPDLKPTHDPRQFIREAVRDKLVVTQPRPDSQWAVLNYLGFLYDVTMGADYRHLEVPIGTEMEAVLAGRGDIATAFPPDADVAIERGLTELFDFSHFFGPYVLSALCTRRSVFRPLLGRHEALITALEQAVQYAYAFPAEAVRIARREFPDIDPVLIGEATMRCLRRQYVPEHVFVGGEAWRASQILNKFVGTLREYHEPLEVVDNEAALRAYRALGHMALAWDGPRATASDVEAPGASLNRVRR